MCDGVSGRPVGVEWKIFTRTAGSFFAPTPSSLPCPIEEGPDEYKVSSQLRDGEGLRHFLYGISRNGDARCTLAGAGETEKLSAPLTPENALLCSPMELYNGIQSTAEPYCSPTLSINVVAKAM